LFFLADIQDRKTCVDYQQGKSKYNTMYISGAANFTYGNIIFQGMSWSANFKLNHCKRIIHHIRGKLNMHSYQLKKYDLLLEKKRRTWATYIRQDTRGILGQSALSTMPFISYKKKRITILNARSLCSFSGIFSCSKSRRRILISIWKQVQVQETPLSGEENQCTMTIK
jgi:hypothetical protein